MTVGIDQNGDDLQRRIGALPFRTVMPIEFAGIQLLKNIVIDKAIMRLRQQIENISREQLMFPAISGRLFKFDGHGVWTCELS